MPARLVIIWDYDAALGQVNATYPYKFREQTILDEIDNVDRILEQAERLNVKMTFACLGFAAEEGHFPYHIPDQIRRIRAMGHEVASHSWKHEWFPFLDREQIRRSLLRSKTVLEACVGEPGCVKGFVPPFSRPMTWYRKAALSVGDRAFAPWHAGGNLGSLLRIAGEVGYEWCRVAYRPIWKILADRRGAHLRPLRAWTTAHRMTCVPHHYTGFDAAAFSYLQRAVEESKTVVITAHPSGLSRDREESAPHFRAFLETVAQLQRQGLLASVTASECIGTSSPTAESLRSLQTK